jgi:7-carboxy-7-deazaguanine synthase
MSTGLRVVERVPAAQRVAPLKGLPDGTLLIHEVYCSVQGESTFQGRPCVFVRTTGCHLRCSYCDTEHAFYQGQQLSLEDVLERVRAVGVPLVEFTGGEPLLQPLVTVAMARLCDEGFTVLLETSGGVSTADVDPRVRIILDIKTPGSGEHERNVWSNLDRLRPHDEVKFVLCTREDYVWAKDILRQHALERRCTVLFSPVTPGVNPADVAQWVVEDRLPVRFQVQLHKVLWGDKRGV